ncbi:SpoIIE family protein phosphatase [uncultured Microscilla sp.]|uniref:SpoIIE family protein phosphatase n=1 Tax=uncultured Microscilla sp. TaxID=432653 RepID=UPI0026269BDC|nr:SpoIIE family protein phosphatase [uncultured Microscilla sp.]
MVKWILCIALLICGVDIAQAQTSWQEAKITQKAEIKIYHINITPFIYKEDNQVKGLEADIIRGFVKFVKKKYNIEVIPVFQEQESFGKVYQLMKGGYPGEFAASTFSVTEERKEEVVFSPVYMPDIEVLISSANLPILQDSNEVATSFKGVTAAIVPRSTGTANLQRIATYLPSLRYKKVKHFDDLTTAVATHTNHIAYIQLAEYLMTLKKGLKIKRQNLFQVNKAGRAIVLPKKSGWKEPIDAFFNSAEFKPWINELIKKYFGHDVKELIWKLSSSHNQNQQNLLLFTKEKEISELEIAKKQLEIERQTLLRNVSIATVLAILLIAFFIFNRYQLQQKTNRLLQKKNEEILHQKQELIGKNEELQLQQEEILSQQNFIESKNTELERKNKEVSDSIQAAQVIQKAILPFRERMAKHLKNFFVLYRPKDIVSGDFYWLHQRDNKVFLAVVDCTGHGVPGAFMSMIGYMILDKLVIVDRLNDPAEILNRCHASVMNVLEGNDNSGDYGMDVAFLMMKRINEQQTKATFSGAKRPLLYVPAGTKSIQEISGNRRSIGGVHKYKFHFSNHEVTLENGSLIYLSTDGFSDQNNTERKKYGKQRFKEMLKSIANQPLTKQKEGLEQALDDHMFGTVQRDDILLIGFRV